MPSKRWFLFAAGAAFGVFLVATCGGGGGRFIPRGDGGALFDGLFSVGDAAAAGPPLMGACDKTFTFTVADPNGTYTQVQTTYYADLPAAGLDPTSAPLLSAVVCGYQCFGSSCQNGYCPTGANCSASGTLPHLNCATVNAELDNGRVVVFCGSRVTTTYPNTPQNNYDGGSTYQQVYVRVN